MKRTRILTNFDNDSNTLMVGFKKDVVRIWNTAYACKISLFSTRKNGLKIHKNCFYRHFESENFLGGGHQTPPQSRETTPPCAFEIDHPSLCLRERPPLLVLSQIRKFLWRFMAVSLYKLTLPWKGQSTMDLFVLLLYVPSQQLWSWRDGQFT